MQQISIAGNIGKDAELRTTQSGDKVCSFSVAVSNGKGKDSTWYRVSIFGKRADALHQYLTKGSRVAVSGPLAASIYKDRVSLDVKADQISLLGGGQNTNRDDNRDSQAGYGGGYGAPVDDEIPF